MDSGIVTKSWCAHLTATKKQSNERYPFKQGAPMNKTLILSICALFLSGCMASSPTKEQIGYGRFAHLKTNVAGSLIGQATYRHPLDCEMNLKNGWSNMERNGIKTKCSTEDLTPQLSHYLSVTSSSNTMTPLEFRFINK